MVYTPSPLVRYLHGFPHFTTTPTLALTSKDWDIATGNGVDDNVDYLISVSFLPAMVLLFMLMLLMIVCLLMCCTCCCRCYRHSFYGSEWQNNVVRLERRYRLAVLAVFLFVFAVANLLWIPKNFEKEGIQKVYHSANVLRGLVGNLTDIGDMLTSSSTSLTSAFKEMVNDCNIQNQSTSDTILSELNEFEAGTKSYNGMVQPLPGDIRDFQNALALSADGVSWATFGMVLLLALCTMQIVFAIFGDGCFFSLLRCTGTLSYVLYMLLLCALVSLGISLTTAAADFCMDPTSNALGFIDVGSSEYNITHYYSTCTGASPFNGPFKQADTGIQTAIESTATLQTELCSPHPFTDDGIYEICCNQSIPTFNAQLSLASSDMGDLKVALRCGPFTNQWENTWTGICTHSLKGFYYAWVIEANLFVLLLAGCIVLRLFSDIQSQRWTFYEPVYAHEVSVSAQDLIIPGGLAEEIEPLTSPLIENQQVVTVTPTADLGPL